MLHKIRENQVKFYSYIVKTFFCLFVLSEPLSEVFGKLYEGCSS